MPDDVVLGRNGGVIFIRPQLAERVVQSSWLKENIDKLPVAREQVEEILKRRQR